MSVAVHQIEALYRAHGPALLVYLRRLAGRRDLAEDLLQETFVQAMRGIDRLGDVVSPRAWLFAIARNVGVSALRRRRWMASLADDVPALPEETEDPQLERMRAGIERLPDKLREALELRLRHDLSYDEIAVVLSIPVGTVRSRLHHAVRQLRETLVNERGTHGS